MLNQRLITLLPLFLTAAHAWTTAPLSQISHHKSTVSVSAFRSIPLHAVKEPKSPSEPVPSSSSSSIDETTEKYGLEVGLVESLKKDDGGQSAKDLLAKYGVAYLATSIPLAIVSFAICYALVDSGVDVPNLLSKVGITVGDTGEKVGTFAIAYAAHKAASPIRFPPTVLLTPVVAKLIGKEPEGEVAE